MEWSEFIHKARRTGSSPGPRKLLTLAHVTPAANQGIALAAILDQLSLFGGKRTLLPEMQLNLKIA